MDDAILQSDMSRQTAATRLLKMSMCGPDARWVATIGDWTWDYAAQQCGVDVFRASDPQGQPSYLAFSYVHLLGHRTFPINAFSGGDRIELRSSGFRPSHDSLDVIHQIWRHGSPSPPVRSNYEELSRGSDPNCVTVETLNRWLVRTREDSNDGLVSAAPREFRNHHLPAIPDAHHPRGRYRAAIQTQSFAADDSDLEVVSDALREIYQIETERDLNSVGLLYFASYFDLFNIGSQRAARNAGLSGESFRARKVLEQEVVYVKNANGGDEVEINSRGRRSRTGGEYRFDIVIRGKDSGLLSVCTQTVLMEARPVEVAYSIPQTLRTLIEETTGVDAALLSHDCSFGDLGWDSLGKQDLRARLEKTFGVLPGDALSDRSTVKTLAALLSNDPRQPLADARGSDQSHDRQGVVARADIAIIGMSGVFPGAPDVASFWRNLENGESSTGVRREGLRWPGALLVDVDRFDAEFFEISPREASRMDPQQRLFLETAWKAVEDAGYRVSELARSGAGVFLGSGANEYQELLRAAEPDVAPSLLEFCPNLLANRVSHYFNWTGPSELVDMACCSSLAAIHRAVQALRSGECAVALAGGVNLTLTAGRFAASEKAGLLSQNGVSYAFDANADGFIRGEGSAAILLKPLDRALADGDTIRAVIKGSAVHHGGRGESLLDPGTRSQTEAIRKAYAGAGVAPETVSYFETQGSGTALGDARDLKTFEQAAAGGSAGECWLGCLKPNIGHLEAAAGIASVVKVALAMGYRRQPGVANLGELNPRLDLERTRFRISKSSREWDVPAGQLRRASVHGFALGGSSAHLVLEEAPSIAARSASGSAQLFVFSARNPDRLTELLQDMREFFLADSSVNLADVAYTLQVGREEMACRAAVVASSHAELCAGLSDPALRGNVPDTSASSWRLGEDEEDREYVAGLWSRNRLTKIAQLWISGAAILWFALRKQEALRRVPLPNYPFARTRYWVRQPLSVGQAGSLRRVVNPPLHTMVAEILGVSDIHALEARTLRSLGMDSLLAMELKSRLALEWGVSLSIPEIMRAPTLSELSVVAGRPAQLQESLFRADPSTRFEPFPLTDIQKAYLVGRSDAHRMGGYGCHLYWEFASGGWDLGRLQHAWNRLIAHHDMLRASFASDGTQRVHREVSEYQFEIHQGPGLREKMAHETFAPDQWPLFRIGVSVFPDRMRLHFSTDLLPMDGVSIILLLRQWAALYREPETELAPLAVSFRDYALYVERLRSTPARNQALEYWKNRIEYLPPAPELPSAITPGATVYRRHEMRLDAESWERLKRASEDRGCTPAVTLLSAFAETLRLWSKDPRFTLNVTISGRLPVHPDMHEVVGDFTSNVLLGLDLSGRDPFAVRTARLRDQLLQDLDHGLVSGIEVASMLSRKLRDTVLMPVVFTSFLGYDGVLRQVSPDPLGTFVFGVTQTPQVSLDCQAMELDGGVYLSWDVAEAMFPVGMPGDMFASFSSLVERLAGDPATWDGPPPNLLPQAQMARRNEANSTERVLPREWVHSGFLQQAEEHPDRIALIDGERRLTYREVLLLAGDVAREIRAAGIRPSELVAIVMEKGWEQAVAALGVTMSGGAYLPIEASMPQVRIRQLLELGEAKLVLTQSRWTCRIAWPADTITICVDAIELAVVGQAFSLPTCPSTPDDLAYVIYTSGSTGVPKGVMISHQAAVNTILDINQRFAVGPEDRTFALSSLSFDLSVYDIFGVLGAGGAVVFPEHERMRDPQYLRELIQQERITIWNSVPSYMQMLAEGLGYDRLPTLRLVMMSGDWIPVGLPPRIRDLAPGAQIISLGGATEGSIWSICYPIEHVDRDWKSIPYGTPLANQTFFVCNPQMEDCPDGVPGELYIGGAGVAMGYWRDEARTAASFVRHPVSGARLYRTGDWGAWLSDGNIEFLGRNDLQVKIGGFRIELGEIDAAFAGAPGITAGLTIAHKDGDDHRRLAAFYVSDPASGVDAVALRRYLSDKLPAYMIPSQFLPLNEFPLTANGKVDRKALEKVASNGHSKPTVVTERAGSLAEEVAAIWREVLRVQNVAMDENFFEIGGNSFAALQVHQRLCSRIATECTVTDIFRYPTVTGLAEYLSQTSHSAGPVSRGDRRRAARAMAAVRG